jgi:hypothetical protein
MTHAEFEQAHKLTPGAPRLRRTSLDGASDRQPGDHGTMLLVDGQHLQGQPRDVMFLAQPTAPR